MKRVLILALITGMITVSCKKDASEENPSPLPTADYMQLKIGNYWIYQNYHLDSLGNEIPDVIQDTIILIGDTSIRGNLYFKQFSAHWSHTSYIRDSSGYLVDHEGKIRFSDHDFTNILRVDTIGPGLAFTEYRMIDQDTMISVPMGTYPAFNFRGTVTPLVQVYQYGIQYIHYFYAEGVGLIKTSTYYFSNPTKRIGQQLISFGNMEMKQ